MASWWPIDPSMEQHRLLGLSPETIYYVPDFITEAEEKILVDTVGRTPIPRWTQLSNRRLQNWGGVPHPRGMISEEIPPWLTKYTEKVGSLGLFSGKNPNHVLVNEYNPGQGIMPHLDGDMFYATISTINLGSHTILNLYHPLPEEPETSAAGSATESSATKTWPERLACSLLLQPRSLLILKDQAYHHFLHGIEEVSSDVLSSVIMNLDRCKDVSVGQQLVRATRISLTLRFVPKTTKSPMIRLGR